MLEQLEARRMLSVAVKGHVLRIEGTKRDDEIRVEAKPVGLIEIGGEERWPEYIVRINGKVFDLGETRIDRIVVRGWAGDDRIELRPAPAPSRPSWMGGLVDLLDPGTVSVPATIFGGSGDDTLVGGNGDDLIAGGWGRDSISGGKGNDQLYGEGDNDTIMGQEGADTLRGHAGDDELFGDDGDDELYGHAGDDAMEGGYGADHVSGGPGVDVGSDCGVDAQAAGAQAKLFASAKGVESMVKTVSMSKHSYLIDGGDFYWYFDEREYLLRATDSIVVGLNSSEDRESVVAALTAESGPLAGFTAIDNLGTKAVQFKREVGLAGRLEGVLTRIREVEGVAYASPGFVSRESGLRWWATNQLIVKLRENADPQEVLGEECSSFTPSFGSYLATLKTGGGLDALAAVDRLHSNPLVEWADVNAYAEGRLG